MNISKRSRLSFLKKVDLFGKTLMFEEHDVQSHQTSIGALFTYLMFIALSVVTFLFGKEIYQRKKPYLLESEEIMTSDIAFVDLREFPIFFSFSNLYGNNISVDIHDILNVFLFYYATDYNSVLTYELLYGFTECNSTYYTKHQDLVDKHISDSKKINKTLYCINHQSQENFKLALPFLSNGSKNIKIMLNQCNNSKRKSSYSYFKNNNKFTINDLDTCLDQKSLDYYYQKIIMRVEFFDSFYDYKNFDNPEVYYTNSFSKQITKGDGFINTNMQLGLKQLLSDESWIFEHYYKTNINFFKSENNEYLVPTEFSKELFTLSLDVSNKVSVSTRYYMKIQDLFAQVGGFFNAITIVIKVLLYDYVRFRFKLNYSKYTVDISNFNQVNHNKRKEFRNKKDYKIKDNNSNANIISNDKLKLSGIQDEYSNQTSCRHRIMSKKIELEKIKDNHLNFLSNNNNDIGNIRNNIESPGIPRNNIMTKDININHPKSLFSINKQVLENINQENIENEDYSKDNLKNNDKDLDYYKNN